MANRKAQMAFMREAAMRGDGIAGACFELESAAHSAGLGYLSTTAFDYRDADELDDIRPY